MAKWLAKPLILLIRIYQVCISPILPATCRFTPTCSTYAIQALKRYGPIKGLALAVWRICRCNPFSAGGHDPVPTNDESQKNQVK